jgi:hypothetical protein
MSGYKLNSDAHVAVATDYFWLPMQDAPRGVKLQLLTRGGVAVHGQVSADNISGFDGWTPLPQRHKTHKEE